MKMKPLLVCGLLCIAGPHVQAAVIAAYQFDETSGNVADDAIRSSVDSSGTLSNFGGTQWVTGKIGNALLFDGANDYVWAADPLGATTTQLSVSAWIWAGDPSTAGLQAPNQWGSITKAWGAGQFHFGFNAATGSIGNYLNTSGANPTQSPSTLSLEAWHHVAFTYDGTVGEHKLYIDGSLMDTKAAPLSLTSDGTHMGIGVKLNSGTATTPATDGSQGYWKGMIDDLVYFDNALTETEINTIITNGNNGCLLYTSPSPRDS